MSGVATTGSGPMTAAEKAMFARKVNIATRARALHGHRSQLRKVGSPYAIAAKELYEETGVHPAEWITKSGPLNTRHYERMRDLAGIPPLQKPARKLSMRLR